LGKVNSHTNFLREAVKTVSARVLHESDVTGGQGRVG